MEHAYEHQHTFKFEDATIINKGKTILETLYIQKYNEAVTYKTDTCM